MFGAQGAEPWALPTDVLVQYSYSTTTPLNAELDEYWMEYWNAVGTNVRWTDATVHVSPWRGPVGTTDIPEH